MSQATDSNHSNAFTFTLLLSEGRAGEAWESSYKIMLFPIPTIKCLSLFSGLFTFIYSSTFYISLRRHVTIREPLELVFSIGSMTRLYKGARYPVRGELSCSRESAICNRGTRQA
jgi:hypothetical protein